MRYMSVRWSNIQSPRYARAHPSRNGQEKDGESNEKKASTGPFPFIPHQAAFVETSIPRGAGVSLCGCHLPGSQPITPNAQMWEVSGYDIWLARQLRLPVASA